jgi:hypothetical protein
MEQASRLIGYSVSKLDVGGVACMELRFDSSAGGKFSDAKCAALHGMWLDAPEMTTFLGIASSNG